VTAPIVAAVDGTTDSRRALQVGIDLATRTGASLRLVHVRHDNVVLSPMAPLFPESALDEMAATVLHEALNDVRRMGWHGADPETVLALPPRVPALVEHTHDASFVVLGTRAAPAQHLVTGSTTNGVAAHSTVPVICVPGDWNPQVRHARVAVGADGTKESAVVISKAADMAQDLEASLLVMHAWHSSGPYAAASFGRGFEKRWEEETRPMLDSIVDAVRASHPDVKIDVQVRFTRPVDELHELSKACDLVVVGRHSQHHKLSPTLGTTARTVIRTSRCPVLVVPGS
jgi:nucleotide-binding universal stress UspA family protein